MNTFSITVMVFLGILAMISALLALGKLRHEAKKEKKEESPCDTH